MQDRKKITTLFFALVVLFVSLSVCAVLAQTSVDLSMPIPGFTDKVTQRSDQITLCAETNGILKCEGIARYVAALYTWLVGLTLILGVIALMAGGVIWMIAGGSDKRVTQAKNVIKNSLVGISLALLSYLALWTISPNLVQFRPIIIPKVKEITLKIKEVTVTEESGMTSGDISSSAFAFSDPNIHCPRSGGPAELPQIVDSLDSKIAYRMGGNGGPPPYKEYKDEYKLYNDSCPEKNLCFDCGGYINYLLLCAGMNAPGMGTANIFQGAEQITTYDIGNRTINGVSLQPGDLIGHGGSPGHVAIYVGGEWFTHTHNGKNGRKAGANPSRAKLSEAFMKNTWVKEIRRYR